MIDYVIQDREMIIEAVLEGILPEDYITDEELYDLEETLFELVCEQHTPFSTWETLQ